MATEVINIILELVDKFSKNVDAAQSKIEGFKSKVEGLSSAFAPVSAAAGMALGESVRLAADFDKAIQGAVRGLDLADNEIGAFTKSVKDLSAELQYQFSSTELAGIVTEAGKLGIAKSDVDDFAKVMAKVAIATDQKGNIDKLATNAAKIASVYKMNTAATEEYLAAVNKLDDASSATSNQILNFTQRVSGAASSAKIAGSSIAAFGATLISSGKEPETAATFMNKYLSVLGAATNTSKDAQNSFKKLGFSAKELAVRFDKDAIGTMQLFLKRVKALDKVTQRDILGRIFGQEHVGSALLMVEQTDLLAKSLKEAGDKSDNISKLNKEYDKFAKNSFEGQMNTFNNMMKELGVTVGATLLPGINKLLQVAVIPLVKKINELTDKHPQLSSLIAGFLGIVAVVTPVAMVVSSLATAATVIPALAIAVKGLAVGLWALAAPFAPILIGIAAVAGGAYLIWKNWLPIKQKLIGFWSDIQIKINSFSWWIKSDPLNAATTFLSWFTPIPAITGEQLNKAVQKVQSFANWIASLGNYFYNSAINWGAGLIDGFVNGINSKISSAQNAISQFTNGIGQYLPHSDAQKGALSKLTASGQSLGETFMSGLNSYGIGANMGRAVAPIGGGLSSLQPSPVFSRSAGNNPASSPVTVTNNYQISGSNDELIKQLKRRDRELLDLLAKSGQRINRSTY
jgi:TP901 family phage tail tape measure protein